MAIESGIVKTSFKFQFKTPEFSLAKITKVFSLTNIPETLFLDGFTMILGYFDPIYARLRYQETVTEVEVLFTTHLSEDEAIFNENAIGFSFLTIPKNPLLFPYEAELILMNGITPPDVAGTKANIRLSSIAGMNKFAVFRCEPGFV